MTVTKTLDLGEIVVSRTPTDVLEARDLASCLAVCIYDPVAKVGGIVKVMLPDSGLGRAGGLGVFADTAVQALLSNMEELGATAPDCEVAVVGGASLLAPGSGRAGLTLGSRNTERVNGALAKAGLQVRQRSTGGRRNRHVQLRIGDGAVSIREI